MFFFSTYIYGVKFFIVQLASGRWLDIDVFIHIQFTDGSSSFYASFSVRLGLDASYQIIHRRYVEIGLHTDIVIKLGCLARDFVRCTIESLKYIFLFKSQIDEELLDLGVLLLQLLLHQDLFLVFHLAVLRDGGVAVELQLVVDVLRLAWLVVSVLFEVVVGKGHLAELLLIGGIMRRTSPELL